MKNETEFRSEVFRRANAEKIRIKKRRKETIVALVLAAVLIPSAVVAARAIEPRVGTNIRNAGHSSLESFTQDASDLPEAEANETATDAATTLTPPSTESYTGAPLEREKYDLQATALFVCFGDGKYEILDEDIKKTVLTTLEDALKNADVLGIAEFREDILTDPENTVFEILPDGEIFVLHNLILSDISTGFMYGISREQAQTLRDAAR